MDSTQSLPLENPHSPLEGNDCFLSVGSFTYGYLILTTAPIQRHTKLHLTKEKTELKEIE